MKPNFALSELKEIVHDTPIFVFIKTLKDLTA